ncbi:MAG: calcium-translocating P-type ATPase, PMCA-type [Clostridia bacterium]|nr:calcium-translocating P-type ATPase, PMCA-type [Clostridia bacterium]
MEHSGLTTAQVNQAREQYGGNSLSERPRRRFLSVLAENLSDPIIRILLAALGVNIALWFRAFEWYESLGIAVSILLSTLVSSISERGSEQAFARLQTELTSVSCRVRRDGETLEIPHAQVVVGDVVLLQAGERIPADGFLMEGELSLDQSALNGESREAKKRAGRESAKPDFLDGSSLFRGAVVCSGEGVMRVTKVGDHTVYGALAAELQERTRESPLKVRLGVLARTISRLGYGAAVLVGLADLFESIVLASHWNPILIETILTTPTLVLTKLLHALTLAITVVVVAVPEGLPMMITVVLSANMRRLLRDQVLVRRLVGIETSGSLNLLFCDKTGTLTSGKLSVVSFWDGSGREYDPARLKKTKLEIRYAVSCFYNNQSSLSKGKPVGGNATDRALLASVWKLPREHMGWQVLERVPFDSIRKFSAVRLRESDGSVRTLTKGAPEILLPRCRWYLDEEGTKRPLSHQTVRACLARHTGSGLRVLCLTEDGDTLIGLVGLRDPLRKSTPEAVQQLHTAGVQVVMITGDNEETACAVARAAGVWDGTREDVLQASVLDRLSDEELKSRLAKLRVIARAQPGHKSRLVRIAQEMGLVVGMTGDGVNDAPALKIADVGFALGSGTEVAREAGDIIILDDNVRSIARAVLYGRTIFKSIRKFIVFQLTMNLCAVGVSVAAPMIGIDTPITVIQMLWVNIIMDTLAGLAFAGEPPRRETMQEAPKKREEPVFNRTMLGQVLVMGGYAMLLNLGFLKSGWARAQFGFTENPVYFLTCFFALFIFTAVSASFHIRTPRIRIFSGMWRNPSFMLIMLLVALVQTLMIYVGGPLMRTTALTGRDLGAMALLAMTTAVPSTVYKLRQRYVSKKAAAANAAAGKIR